MSRGFRSGLASVVIWVLSVVLTSLITAGPNADVFWMVKSVCMPLYVFSLVLLGAMFVPWLSERIARRKRPPDGQVDKMIRRILRALFDEKDGRSLREYREGPSRRNYEEAFSRLSEDRWIRNEKGRYVLTETGEREAAKYLAKSLKRS